MTWRNWKCVDKFSAHARGPTVQRADGGNSFNGVRAIRLISNERYTVVPSSYKNPDQLHAVSCGVRVATVKIG